MDWPHHRLDDAGMTVREDLGAKIAGGPILKYHPSKSAADMQAFSELTSALDRRTGLGMITTHKGVSPASRIPNLHSAHSNAVIL